MNNLALSYSDLGRHEEALEMREKTMQFYRRVLPENHPVRAIYSSLDSILFDFYFGFCRPVVVQHQQQLHSNR